MKEQNACFYVIIAFLICLSSEGLHADTCSTPLWLYYSGPSLCYYFKNVTITDGPTSCRESIQQGDAEVECYGDGSDSDSCYVNTSQETRDLHQFSGALTYKGFGLTASEMEETKTITSCQKNYPISVECQGCGDHQTDSCCRESWIEYSITTKRADLWEYDVSGFETGECDEYPDEETCGGDCTDQDCTTSATDKKCITSHCGMCSEMDLCE